MANQSTEERPDDLTASWAIPSAARLGSSVRSKGIFLELRARLPAASRKAFSVKAGDLILRMGRERDREFEKAAMIISAGLVGIEDIPVIPREIQDILAISTTERHRWLKDGRLPSAGTRTVKLRGRARKITFHVFDPRVVEDLLDRDAVDAWREVDALAKAENRRRAAWKRRPARAEKLGEEATSAPDVPDPTQLRGWAEFEKFGLLR